MREIKFRAWHRDNKCWLDSVCVYSDGSWVGTLIEERGEVSGYDERECDLMQYTGLKDKNGVEIYEDDIVNRKNNPDLHCLVYFDERDFSWRLAVNGDKQYDKTYPLMFADEVIGNIYENQELINE